MKTFIFDCEYGRLTINGVEIAPLPKFVKDFGPGVGLLNDEDFSHQERILIAQTIANEWAAYARELWEQK